MDWSLTTSRSQTAPAVQTAAVQTAAVQTAALQTSAVQTAALQAPASAARAYQTVRALQTTPALQTTRVQSTRVVPLTRSSPSPSRSPSPSTWMLSASMSRISKRFDAGVLVVKLATCPYCIEFTKHVEPGLRTGLHPLSVETVVYNRNEPTTFYGLTPFIFPFLVFHARSRLTGRQRARHQERPCMPLVPLDQQASVVMLRFREWLAAFAQDEATLPASWTVSPTRHRTHPPKETDDMLARLIHGDAAPTSSSSSSSSSSPLRSRSRSAKTPLPPLARTRLFSTRTTRPHNASPT